MGSTTSSTSAAITAPPASIEPPGPKPFRLGPRSPASPLGHKPSWDRPSCALSRPEPIKLTVPFVERLEPPRGSLHPQRQGRAVEPHALTLEDLRLPIQRDVPGELGDRDMGDERGCGHAALNQAGRALGLDDRSLAGPASVLREDRSLHPHKGRDHVESLARLL